MQIAMSFYTRGLGRSGFRCPWESLTQSPVDFERWLFEHLCTGSLYLSLDENNFLIHSGFNFWNWPLQIWQNIRKRFLLSKAWASLVWNFPFPVFSSHFLSTFHLWGLFSKTGNGVHICRATRVLESYFFVILLFCLLLKLSFSLSLWVS